MRIVSTTHLISTLDELAQLYPAPSATSRNKVHDCLNDEMQHWLQQSPFFILSSQGDDGIDCSPRGDAPGQAFRVLDAHTIAIPDRRGNNRVDTLRNILVEPRVGMVFLIPGVEEALRVKGQACICVDPALLETFSLNDEPPRSVIVVSVVAAIVQNARAVRRSRLWEADFRIDAGVAATAARLSSKA